jgi:hypothetical protein
MDSPVSQQDSIAAAQAETDTDGCPNCGTALTAEYCPTCGQRRIHGDDLTIGHALHHVAHELTHLDGKTWNTLRSLFTRPGELALDYIEGRRQRHIHPIRLFLVLSALFYFLGLQAANNLQVMVDSSPPIAAKLTRAAQQHGVALPELVSQIEPAFQRYLKVLNVASVVVTGLVLLLLFFDRNRKAAAHQIVALQLSSFSFAISVAEYPIWLLARSPMLLAAVAVPITLAYTALTVKRVYGIGWTSTLWRTAVYAVVGYALVANLQIWAAIWITLARLGH